MSARGGLHLLELHRYLPDGDFNVRKPVGRNFGPRLRREDAGFPPPMSMSRCAVRALPRSYVLQYDDKVHSLWLCTVLFPRWQIFNLLMLGVT